MLPFWLFIVILIILGGIAYFAFEEGFEEVSIAVGIIGAIFILFYLINGLFFSQKLKFVGSITDEYDAQPNDYLVILYLEEQEIGRSVTHLGEFKPSREGRDDGYFHITVPNTYKLNRRQLEPRFKKSFWGHLWHFFPDISLNKYTKIYVRDKGVTYTLVVFPSKVETLPPLLMEFETTLNDHGEVVLEVQQSELPAENKELEAWVSELNEQEIIELTRSGRDYIDINDCDGAGSVVSSKSQSRTYVHEYEFETGIGVEIGLEVPIGPLLSITPELGLGYSHGQVDSEEAIVEVNVPPKKHTRYEIIWSEVWDTGIINTRNTITDAAFEVPFRSRAGLLWEVTSNDIDCP